MKSKLVLSMLFLANAVLSVKSQEITVLDLYKNLDTSRISTGILYNTVIPYSSLINRTGENDTSIIVNGEWLQMYNELYNAYLTNSKAMIPVQGLKELIKASNNCGIIPIGVINCKFNLFKDSALTKNLISIQNDCLYDGPNFSESPYIVKTCFSSSVLCNDVDSLNLIFSLKTNFIFTNYLDQFLYFKVDFGDGNGYINMNLDDEHFVNYMEYGSKILHILGYLSNGDSLKCSTSINILNTSTNIPVVNQFAMYSENFSNNEPLSYFNSQDSVSEIFSIVADETIDDSTFSGRYKIWYGCGSEKVINKPLIIVEGFDPTNTNTLETNLYNISNQNSLLNILRENGYDVIILDFDDGGGKIQGNAMVLKELIDTINLQKVEKYDLVILGASMGGLVTKYALSYMEDHQIDHQTGLFISLDSPHKGAYVSLGLQFFMSKLEYAYYHEGLNKIISLNSYESLNADMKKINCDAAKQMLVYYYSSSTSDHASQHIDRYNFINDPYNKMPTKCKSIAISCGSGNGQNQGYNAGTIQYYVSDSIDLKAKWQIGTIGDDPPEPIYLEAEYENGAYFSLKIKSLPNNQSIWFLESHLLVLAGSIGNYPLGSLIFPSLRSVNEHLSSPIKPYDNCPGGYQQLIKGLVYALADLGIPHNNYESKECFVPSISALDLNTEDLFFNIYGSLTDGNNYFINNGNPITPFSEFFVDSINQPHIVNGISLGMVRWILNQTVKDTMYIQDTTFTSVEKQLEAKKVIFSGSGLLGNNFKIINNSKITFVAGESIILSPGFSVESGSEFHAYI